MIGQLIRMNNSYVIKFLIYLYMCLFLVSNICLADDNTKWLKINKAGMAAFKEGDFINSEKLYLEAITEARKTNLEAELSATLNNLGLLKIELLEYSEAETLINESLKLRLKYYSPNHRYVAQSYNNLARVYEFSHRINESIDLYIKAINIYETLGPRYSMLLARTLINLSTVQLNTDMFDMAKINLLRVLALSKEFKEDNSVSLSVMHNLAVLFTQQGNFIEAEEIYINLIRIRRKVGDSQSIDFVRILNNLSVLYKKNCQYDLALPYISEALTIWENIKSMDYLNYAKAYHNQGELYKAQGKYDLAIESFKKGINIISNYSDIFYEQYMEQSYALINLYLKSGKLNEAKELMKNINLQKKKKGETLLTIENLPEEVYENCSSSNI